MNDTVIKDEFLHFPEMKAEYEMTRFIDKVLESRVLLANSGANTQAAFIMNKEVGKRLEKLYYDQVAELNLYFSRV